jgi:hypothetical protein
MCWRALLSLLAAAFLLITAGCQSLGVTWLPDSTGLVFAVFDRESEFAIGHYDLKSKSAKLIRHGVTVVPAVSPDGKRVAIADLLQGDATHPTRLEIVISSLDGRELSRSKPLDLGRPVAKEHADELVGLTGVIWGPGDRFLVGFASAEGGKAGTAAYSGTKQSWTLLENVLPWVQLDVSPILPNGTGVLALREPNLPAALRPGNQLDKPEPVLVGLDGEVRLLLTPEGKRVTLDDAPTPVAARWDGDVLLLSLNDQSVRIDTVRGTWTAKPLPPPATRPADVQEAMRKQSRVVASYTFAKTGVRIACQTIDIKKERQRGSLPHLTRYHFSHGYQIGVCKPGTVEVITTIAQTDSDDDVFGMSENHPMMMLFPSPDGTRLAVRCTPSRGEDTVFIVNDRGEVTDVLKCRSLLANR